MIPETNCSILPPSASLGCVVILEPGAKWPEQIFANVPYRDGVVVLGESADEPLDIFIARLNTQCALMAASGITFRAAIVACNDDEPGLESHRQMLTSDIEEHVFAEHTGSVILVRKATESARGSAMLSQ